MKKYLTATRQRETAISDKRRPQDYLKLPYARILIPEEDGRFSAEVLEFPGCYSQGRHAGEAFDNLEKAATAWIETCLDLGQEIPPPSVSHGYSGRIALRLPRGLHRVAVHKAQRDGISLNQCLVTAIAAWVGADNLYERITHRVEMNFIHMTNYIQITASGSSGSPWIVPWNTVSVAPVTPERSSGIYIAGMNPQMAQLGTQKETT
jgi:predicted RNase H-like HicB family nuclease